MKIEFNNKEILLFLLATSTFALMGAYISQYVFGLQPCILCIYQRIPFYLVAFISLFVIVAKKNNGWQKAVILLSIALLVFNALLALYHVGVEEGLFVFDKCADFASKATNIDDLKDLLESSVAVRCDEPQFIFLGLSMAAWNVIYCFGLAVTAFLAKKKFFLLTIIK